MAFLFERIERLNGFERRRRTWMDATARATERKRKEREPKCDPTKEKKLKAVRGMKRVK